MDMIEQIEKLDRLRVQGAISDAEFDTAKRKILSEDGIQISDGTIHGIEAKTWCTIMHLSQLLAFSGVGIIAPIIMWLLGNDKSVLVRRHGNRMMNWIVSSLIYATISLILCFVFVGIPLILIVGLLTIIFPIIAAVKSNDGQVWTYPLTFKFFAED